MIADFGFSMADFDLIRNEGNSRFKILLSEKFNKSENVTLHYLSNSLIMSSTPTRSASAL
jgi:hypothetical protein